MSRLFSICLFFALSVAGGSVVHAQNVVPNGDIESNCGTNSGGCPTFSASCVPGWSISHGTPQLLTSGGIIGPSEFSMWSMISGASLLGEGVFATLAQGTPTNGSYELCFYYRVTSGTGNVVARFTTGLTHGGTSCGDPIPNPSTQLVAHNSTTVGGGWQQVIVNVSSAQSFTQLNLYPVSNSTTPLWIEIDGVNVNYCGANLLATPTSLPVPSGFYSRSGTITATSAGGSGFVTPNPSVATVFVAGQFVLLQPNFLALPNPGQFFMAYIGSCDGCGRVAARTAEVESPFQGLNLNEPLAALAPSVTISPNPTKGGFTIRATDAIHRVTVTDLTGKVLMHLPDQMEATEISVDITHLASGLYFVKGETRMGQKFLQKIVKD
jgi:hypothetical protein